MILKELKEKKILDDFLENAENPSFLQSWNWHFMYDEDQFKHLYIERDSKIILSALVLIEYIPLLKRKYLYIPYAPVFLKKLDYTEKEKIFNFFIENLDKYFKTYDFIFIESNLLNNEQNLKLFRNWSKTILHINPSDSFILDLTLSADDLLKNMHHKTRYNIRLAKKKGVEIIWDKSLKYFDQWYLLMQEMANRNKIRLLSKNHYKKELEKGVFILELAFYEGVLLAGNLISFDSPVATYVHGGSSNKRRNLMAPYLLQWEAILKAKSLSKRYYDFWGVSVGNRNQSWKGISRFKYNFSLKTSAVSYIASRVYIKNFFSYYFILLLHYLRKIKKFVLTR